jgi:hypothetical protein
MAHRSQCPLDGCHFSTNTSWCRLDIADQTVDEAAETRKEHEKVVAV